MAGKLRDKLFASWLIPITLSFVKEVEGLENAPEGGFVIAANHESYIDPLIIKALFDRNFSRIVFYLTKKEAYGSLLKKFFFDSVGTIPVDRQKRDDGALEEAVKNLKSGGIAGVFPEGTRSKDGKLHKGKTGAVRLALAAQCPILPIGISNTFELWPPQKKFPRLEKEAVIKIGKPITINLHEIATKEVLRSLTNNLMQKISELSGQEYVEDENK